MPSPPPPSPPPPPISREAQNAASQDASATALDNIEKDRPTLGKQELLEQLRGRRKEVEHLMAKRRAEREGITVAVRRLIW